MDVAFAATAAAAAAIVSVAVVNSLPPTPSVMLQIIPARPFACPLGSHLSFSRPIPNFFSYLLHCRVFVHSVNRKSYYFRLGCNRIQTHTRTRIYSHTRIHVSADNVPISRRATMNNQLPEPTTKTVLAQTKKRHRTSVWINEHVSIYVCAFYEWVCVSKQNRKNEENLNCLQTYTHTQHTHILHTHTHIQTHSNHFSLAIVVAIIKLFHISASRCVANIHSHHSAITTEQMQ